MTRASSVSFLFAGAVAVAGIAAGGQLAACSSSDEITTDAGSQVDASTDAVGNPSDSATGDGGTTPGDDASTPLPTVAEVEPNNGTATDAGGAQTQLVAFPSNVTGAINPADDIDVFSASLVAGDVWTWTLDAKSSAMAPHLGLSELGNKVPTMAAKGAAGGSAEQEHFVFETETFFAIVRDARNVGTSQHVGSAAHTYQLTGRKTPRTPTALVVPSTAQGTLRTKTAIATYAFTLTQQTGLDIELKGTRKAPASNIDSRMSLFDATKKKYLITNDDISGSITDSKVGGVLPASDYVLVVENVAPDATDLSFELVTTLR
jgi:hypothetical protein